MKKSTIVGVVVGLLILAGAAGVYLLESRKSAPQDVSIETARSPESSNTLRELMSTINNQSCTFEDDEGNSGIVYVSDEKMRGDFQTNESGTGHTVLTDNTMYVWFDGASEGFKSSIDSFESLRLDDQKGAPDILDMDSDVNYSCTSWDEDPSVFSIPQDIEFVDYSSMINAASVYMNTSETHSQGSQNNCAVCENLPAGAKEHCLTSLSCN